MDIWKMIAIPLFIAILATGQAAAMSKESQATVSSLMECKDRIAKDRASEDGAARCTIDLSCETDSAICDPRPCDTKGEIADSCAPPCALERCRPVVEPCEDSCVPDPGVGAPKAWVENVSFGSVVCQGTYEFVVDDDTKLVRFSVAWGLIEYENVKKSTHWEINYQYSCEAAWGAEFHGSGGLMREVRPVTTYHGSYSDDQGGWIPWTVEEEETPSCTYSGLAGQDSCSIYMLVDAGLIHKETKTGTKQIPETVNVCAHPPGFQSENSAQYEPTELIEPAVSGGGDGDEICQETQIFWGPMAGTIDIADELYGALPASLTPDSA